ncbi:GAF domain-containing protein [Paenibacillus glycinis]|uniref:GAF domain-containing protein n=1 Tax=Paenibacillus glycinis TaxID=2697035 RepID=A0ABW9XYR5_9BACL|nr:GAF domain-containing protein [Paenibacillus glycinis]NBD27878.1 hypothetical protein [Paenibacillus glycinis]
MSPLHEQIQHELITVRIETSSDYCALALQEYEPTRIRWAFVCGNQSQRYKDLLIRPNHDIAGLVIKLGRSVRVDAAMGIAERTRLLHEYAIMSVEHLKSALAVPITICSEAQGALLIGDRCDRIYEKIDMTLITEAANRLNAMLSQMNREELRK